MSCEIVEIDGSLLEGGGQILRIALTISALVQKPIRITKIRAGRSKPGLMEQHLKGLELVRDICAAKVKGAELGSTSVDFWPGKISPGRYTAAVRTAGSISLLLQVALPLTLFANGETTLHLRGGTNAEMAPQIEFTTEVFKPILELFGATFDFDLVRRGYFPKGGGEVVISMKPVPHLKAVDLVDRGNITDVYGYSFVAGTLPLHIAENMTKGAESVLNKFQKAKIETYRESEDMATGNCSGILLMARTDKDIVLGSGALGKRNEKPFDTGVRAGQILLTCINDESSVDEHTQDQIIILMALAKGRSRVKVGKITMHTKTAIFVVEQLTKVKFDVLPCEDYDVIECDGLGLSMYT